MIEQSWYGATVINQVFSGSFSFEGISATVPLFMSLTAGGQYDFANVGDTATFSFNTLPTGVSYTSASGDFLSPTPLPSTWPMLLGGLTGLGFIAHRGSKSGSAAFSAA